MRKNNLYVLFLMLTFLFTGCAAKEQPSENITVAQAKSIALSQVLGATEDNIREFDVDRFEDGGLEYDGKIYYEGKEYSFEIDGYTGTIRSWEVEPIYE